MAVDFIPFISVEGVPGKEFRKQRIVLNEFSGVIFTSRNAVDHFFRICEELKVKMSQETKYFCTSEAIALYLQKYIQFRKRKVFIEENAAGKDLSYHLNKHKDTTRFLYICADVRKDEIPSFMKTHNFNYAEGVMYKTIPVDIKSVNLSKYDLIAFFSPAAVNALYVSHPDYSQGETKIAAFGNATAEAVLEANLKLHLVAPIPGVPSIVASIRSYLEKAVKSASK